VKVSDLVWLSVHADSSQLSADNDTTTTLRQSFNSRCSQQRVTAFITSHVQTAYLKAESSHELHYILPSDETKKGGFERLFAALDTALDQLSLASYGVADTSLEEVFLKITAQNTSQQAATGTRAHASHTQYLTHPR